MTPSSPSLLAADSLAPPPPYEEPPRPVPDARSGAAASEEPVNGVAFGVATLDKDALCGSCREHRCCYSFTVELTVDDVGRIASALGLSPEVFVAYHEVETTERSFLLHPAGPRYRLMVESHPTLQLSREESTDEDATEASDPAPAAEPQRACTFLLRLPGGEHRCGLGSIRPAICDLFPVSRQGGLLQLYEGPGCVRSWSLHELDYARELARAEAYAAVLARHEAFLQDWNGRVCAGKGDAAYPFDFFLDALINWYVDERERSAAE